MGEPHNLEDWAREKGGLFARVLELRSSPAGLTARVRTNYSMDGVTFSVPDDIRIPDSFRRLIDKGEIDARGFLRAR